MRCLDRCDQGSQESTFGITRRERLFPVVEVIHWPIAFHGATKQRVRRELANGASVRRGRIKNHNRSLAELSLLSTPTSDPRRLRSAADAERQRPRGVAEIEGEQ
jgi:hypothetical protein